MEIPLAERAYSRPALGLPEARMINMFVEETPHGPHASARVQRAALTAFATLGSGPIRGEFSPPGSAFGGALFAVSGTGLYKDGASIGTIPGTGAVRFAASATQLVIVASGSAYLSDGLTVAVIADPDLPLVSDVAYLASRFVYTLVGRDRYFFSEVNDAGNIDPLSFETAESSADPNVAVQTLGDEIYFFGSKTVEPWYATGDPDAPFAPTQGREYVKGCASRESIVELDNALFFAGVDRAVYRAEANAKRVSDHGVEERLRRCTSIASITAFGAIVDGHSYYVINIPGQGSFCLDVENAAKGWAEWQSYGRQVFRGRCSVIKDGVTYVGDDTNGTVWTLSPGVYLDGTDPITVLASAFIPVAGGVQRCDNIVLQGARGVGTATGQGSDPVVEMRYSDDQGRTWSNWRAASMGKVGQYSKRPVWQRLGLMREPGRALEFRATDPVLATMTGVLVNVARPHG